MNDNAGVPVPCVACKGSGKRTVKRVNTAAKGRRREHASRKVLEAAGYTVVRSAASKGAFDLIGFSEKDVILVQCKCNGFPSRAEMDALRAFPAPIYAQKIVHNWRDGQTTPDVRRVSPSLPFPYTP